MCSLYHTNHSDATVTMARINLLCVTLFGAPNVLCSGVLHMYNVHIAMCTMCFCFVCAARKRKAIIHHHVHTCTYTLSTHICSRRLRCKNITDSPICYDPISLILFLKRNRIWWERWWWRWCWWWNALSINIINIKNAFMQKKCICAFPIERIHGAFHPLIHRWHWTLSIVPQVPLNVQPNQFALPVVERVGFSILNGPHPHWNKVTKSILKCADDWRYSH